MPPARKTYPYQVAADTPAKRPFPRHVINIQDLIHSNENDTSKGHLVININQWSPQEVSVKRSGDKLTVETRSEDRNGGKPTIEQVTRSYKVPEGGYTQELGAQLSADGLLSVRKPGATKKQTRVIPINIAGLMQMKPGNVIQVNTANLQTEFPMKFAPYVVKGSVQQHWLKRQGFGAERKEEEKKAEESKSPVSADHDQDMGDPESTTGVGSSDEAA